MDLNYAAPAHAWTDALPIGNGRLGAMVFGGTTHDRLQINDDSCWSGAPGKAGARAEDRRQALKIVRSLLAAGEHAEAERASKEIQFGYSEAYQPFLDLLLETEDEGLVGYRRSLDLETAVAEHVWDTERRRVRQEVFASYPDSVIVVRREVVSGDPMKVRVELRSSHSNAVGRTEDSAIMLTVPMPSVSLPMHASNQVTEYTQAPSASVTAHGHVEIRHDGERGEDGWLVNVRRLDLVFASSTDFAGAAMHLHGDTDLLIAEAGATARRAAERPYESLRARHITDHSSLFSSTKLTLRPLTPNTATDDLLRASQSTHDPALSALLFAYGRYLLIAGSRPGSRPLNLQGVWNDKLVPPWSSNYTTNINLQMNYWPAEVTGLSSCHEPLLDWLAELAQSGANTAKTVYGMRGWVAHHNSDIWAFSLPAGEGDGDPAWSMWPLAGAWLSRHLWDRWDFTRNREELADRLLPIMKGAAQFLLDWLVPLPDGTVGTAPSTSPENHFVGSDGHRYGLSTATTADRVLIRELFSNVLEGMAILGEDGAAFGRELHAALERVQPERVAPDARIAEWLTDLPDWEPHHRHQSHLYGLYPGDSILPWRDADLAEAAARTLDQRGPDSTGWSLGWRVALRARLGDGSGALNELQKFLRPMPDSASEVPSMTAPSGVYRNLFCAHPPFQIDGNLGVTAGIVEMLVQSHGGRIRLLPALPAEWADGSLLGVKVRGGATLSFSWEQGRVVHIQLSGEPGARIVIEYGDSATEVHLPAEGHAEIAT